MAFHAVLVLKLLALLGIANTVPLVGKRVFRSHCAWRLDCGANFLDHRPIFGSSKTIRGAGLALLLTTFAAMVVGLGPRVGFIVATAAMAGDLLSSFVKRRLGLRCSSRATGLDQIPESILPLLACWNLLGLSVLDVAAGVAAFFWGEILLSRLSYRLGLRDEPY
jgi:CDP-2,3-bis-(O-geranylgeranyl)-sn-glycerol synthase